MENDKLSVGDVVRLKSGGPAMTITYLSDEGYATCKWFDAGLKLRDGEFPISALEPGESVGQIDLAEILAGLGDS